jgi:hypothetical protein
MRVKAQKLGFKTNKMLNALVLNKNLRENIRTQLFSRLYSINEIAAGFMEAHSNTPSKLSVYESDIEIDNVDVKNKTIVMESKEIQTLDIFPESAALDTDNDKCKYQVLTEDVNNYDIKSIEGSIGSLESNYEKKGTDAGAILASKIINNVDIHSEKTLDTGSDVSDMYKSESENRESDNVTDNNSDETEGNSDSDNESNESLENTSSDSNNNDSTDDNDSDSNNSSTPDSESEDDNSNSIEDNSAESEDKPKRPAPIKLKSRLTKSSNVGDNQDNKESNSKVKVLRIKPRVNR